MTGSLWTNALSVLLLGGGYNTVVVMLGAAALGTACGAVGVFTMLRRRALVADAVAHATLPGVALGFIVGVWLGIPGRSPVLLLLGAGSTAVLAAVVIQWLSSRPRVTEDTATAAVLAGMFGLGLALLSVVQTLRSGGQAGLESYLLGSTAGMLQGEALLIAGLAALVICVLAAFFRPLAVVSFDATFAQASGLSVRALDGLVAVLALCAVVIGLRVVGLVLIVAMLIIPAAAARFWSDRLSRVVILSALFGGISAYGGAAASAIGSKLPTGAMIVVVATGIFVVSLLCGPARGLIPRALGVVRLAGPA